jgi:hypothetical protein
MAFFTSNLPVAGLSSVATFCTHLASERKVIRTILLFIAPSGRQGESVMKIIAMLIQRIVTGKDWLPVLLVPL